MKKLIRSVYEDRKKAANSDLSLDWHAQLAYIDPINLTENCFLAFALTNSEGELPVCVERERYYINLSFNE